MCARDTLRCVAPHPHTHALLTPRAPQPCRIMPQLWASAQERGHTACVREWGCASDLVGVACGVVGPTCQAHPGLVPSS